MRSLILVAVILQLTVIIIEINGYQFGDMISFPRTCCGGIPVYKHYAIYVGDADFKGKQPGQDIFHHTATRIKPFETGCMFGVMETTGEGQKDNYLDGRTIGEHTFTKLPDKDIKNQIEALMKGCGEYSVLNNNCEHLATYVRYGRKITRQKGTVGCLCCFGTSPKKCPDWDKKVDEIEENAEKEEACWKKPCADLAG